LAYTSTSADLPVARLRCLAARFAVEARADGLWFAQQLAIYESGAPHGLSFDEVIGLTPSAGCRPWWQVERRARRDALIREVADKFFPGLPNRRCAAVMSERLDRYQATSWRSDRVWRSPPAARACRVDGLFFALLKLGQPLSPRVIERALGVRHEHPHFRGAPDMRGSAEEVPDALD
jgi:hypothetical protein